MLAVALAAAHCSGGGAKRTGGTGGQEPEEATGGSGTGGATGGSAQTGGAGGKATSPDAAPGTGGMVIQPGTGGSGSGPDAAVASPPDGGAVGDERPACASTVMVADAAALAGAVTAAKAGDCLVLADGTYGGFTISAKGTEAAPVVVKAANRGKVVMTANVSMMAAAYVVVEGFSFTGMASASATDSDHCRITRSRFQAGVARAGGTSKYTRIDHNEFGPKSTGDGHYVHATNMSEFTQIDHNYLHDATGGGSSRDAASLGCCGPEFDYHETGNVFEYNLMVNCSSDAEYISIKSSANTIRYNTFRRNGGTLTLRAGRKSQIYGNYFFGGGGIRAYEDDHKIFNNYIETGTALLANGNGGGHAPLKNAVIVHNTFLGGVTITGTGHTIANNIGGGGGMGNLSQAAAGLVRKGEILAITATSAAVDKAVGEYPFLTEDMQGQPRDKPDIGADEWSMAPEGKLRRPLTEADVGPDAP
jgi:poly(beta-D-mannuronate) lyase